MPLPTSTAAAPPLTMGYDAARGTPDKYPPGGMSSGAGALQVSRPLSGAGTGARYANPATFFALDLDSQTRAVSGPSAPAAPNLGMPSSSSLVQEMPLGVVLAMAHAQAQQGLTDTNGARSASGVLDRSPLLSRPSLPAPSPQRSPGQEMLLSMQHRAAMYSANASRAIYQGPGEVLTGTVVEPRGGPLPEGDPPGGESTGQAAPEAYNPGGMDGLPAAEHQESAAVSHQLQQPPVLTANGNMSEPNGGALAEDAAAPQMWQVEGDETVEAERNSSSHMEPSNNSLDAGPVAQGTGNQAVLEELSPAQTAADSAEDAGLICQGATDAALQPQGASEVQPTADHQYNGGVSAVKASNDPLQGPSAGHAPADYTSEAGQTGKTLAAGSSDRAQPEMWQPEGGQATPVLPGPAFGAGTPDYATALLQDESLEGQVQGWLGFDGMAPSTSVSPMTCAAGFAGDWNDGCHRLSLGAGEGVPSGAGGASELNGRHGGPLMPDEGTAGSTLDVPGTREVVAGPLLSQVPESVEPPQPPEEAQPFSFLLLVDGPHQGEGDKAELPSHVADLPPSEPVASGHEAYVTPSPMQTNVAEGVTEAAAFDNPGVGQHEPHPPHGPEESFSRVEHASRDLLAGLVQGEDVSAADAVHADSAQQGFSPVQPHAHDAGVFQFTEGAEGLQPTHSTARLQPSVEWAEGAGGFSLSEDALAPHRGVEWALQPSEEQARYHTGLGPEGFASEEAPNKQATHGAYASDIMRGEAGLLSVTEALPAWDGNVLTAPGVNDLAGGAGQPVAGSSDSSSMGAALSEPPPPMTGVADGEMSRLLGAPSVTPVGR